MSSLLSIYNIQLKDDSTDLYYVMDVRENEILQHNSA